MEDDLEQNYYAVVIPHLKEYGLENGPDLHSKYSFYVRYTIIGAKAVGYVYYFVKNDYFLIIWGVCTSERYRRLKIAYEGIKDVLCLFEQIGQRKIVFSRNETEATRRLRIAIVYWFVEYNYAHKRLLVTSGEKGRTILYISQDIARSDLWPPV